MYKWRTKGEIDNEAKVTQRMEAHAREAKVSINTEAEEGKDTEINGRERQKKPQQGGNERKPKVGMHKNGENTGRGSFTHEESGNRWGRLRSRAG